MIRSRTIVALPILCCALLACSRPGGLASWYGPRYHGRTTASGETYNMLGLTAAHRSLPFGTYVRVRNLENGRTLVVRINDRGPFVRGRIIDLSYAAARLLGITEAGTMRVKLELMEPDEAEPLYRQQLEALEREGLADRELFQGLVKEVLHHHVDVVSGRKRLPIRTIDDHVG